MNKRPFLILPFVACLLLSEAGSVPAQELSGQEPMHLLRITREVVKPGAWGDYTRVSVARSRALKSANWTRVSVAWKTLTGPDEVLYLTFYNSFEDWGKDQEKVEKAPVLKTKLEELAQKTGSLLESRRDFTTVYHKDISYRGEFDWSQMRCVSIITIHLRPGHHREYLENRKIVLGAHTRANLDEHLAIFTVSSGAPSATYLVIRPVTSLHGFDTMEEMHGAKYGEVLGNENRAKVQALFAASVETEEEDYFCADPQLSYVTGSWAQSNRDFWMAPSKSQQSNLEARKTVKEAKANH